MLTRSKRFVFPVDLVSGGIAQDQGGGHGLLGGIDQSHGGEAAALLIDEDASRGDRLDRRHSRLPCQDSVGAGGAEQRRPHGNITARIRRDHGVPDLLGVNEGNQAREAPREKGDFHQ